jgi:hypothetical protein
MGCLGRATCTLHLVSGADHSERKINVPLHTDYIREAKSLLRVYCPNIYIYACTHESGSKNSITLIWKRFEASFLDKIRVLWL